MIDQYDIKIDDLPPNYREYAEEVGLARALELVEMRGGEPLYVPSMRRVAKAARDRQIRIEFEDGASYKELSRKHGLAVITIRKIIGPNPHRQGRVDKQLQLF